MLSKRYESTEVDRRTWLQVPSGTLRLRMSTEICRLDYAIENQLNTISFLLKDI